MVTLQQRRESRVDLNTILRGLLANFKVDQNVLDLRDPELFETFAAYCVVGQFYRDRFEPDEMRTGGAHDLGIDAAAVIVNGEFHTDADEVARAIQGGHDLRVHFVAIQAKLEERFQAAAFTEMTEGLYDIFQPGPMQLPANDRIKNFRKIVDLIFADIRRLTPKPRLSVWYAMAGTVASDSPVPRQRVGEQRIEGLDRLGELKYRALGVKELQELYQRASSVSAVLRMPDRVRIPTFDGVGKAFIGVVKAQDLVENLLSDGVGAVRASLFHQNVRHFQGYGRTIATEPAVNEEIRQTLRDPTARNGFALLNNGLTIVARDVNPVGDQIHLVDVQIVNGCQTSYVLYDELANLSNDVQIPIKIIESANEDVVDLVVKAANSQNQFRVGDLVARDAFQKQIELFFAGQTPDRRLYYERRSMQYDGMPMEKARIINRGQLTKAYAAMFLDEAHRVARLRELELSRGKDLFRDTDGPMAYYVSAAAFYRVEWLFRNGKLPAIYRPARFRFVAGLKVALLGADALPTAKAAYRAACETVIECAWDPVRAESVANEIAVAVLTAYEAEGANARWNDAVRTARFRLSVANTLVGLNAVRIAGH